MSSVIFGTFLFHPKSLRFPIVCGSSMGVSPTGTREASELDHQEGLVRDSRIDHLAGVMTGYSTGVKPGDIVEESQTVCIVEAMKMMNHITAETSGVIESILVENGQPVEFDQPLFTIV